MNACYLDGFLGKDAELRYTSTGNPFLPLTLATTESWQNDKKEWESKTEWHNIVLWGNKAVQAKELKKGDRVMVNGKLEHKENEWTDKEGVKHKDRNSQVKVETITVLSTKLQRDLSKVPF